MKTVMVRYKVKPDRVEENRTYIERVFKELGETRPAGLRYASFQLPDGVSFVHVASMSTENGENPLSQLSAFQLFVADIKSRCDDPPVAVELAPVGNYGLIAE